MSKYFVSDSDASTGTQPPLGRKLAKKMCHFFASATAESEVEQDSTATAAGTTTDIAAGIASAQTVEPPLIELQSTVSVAQSTSTYEYEPVNVTDVDESVWILRSTTDPTATTCGILHCLSYLTLLTLVFYLKPLFQLHSQRVLHLLHILLFRCRVSICIHHHRLRLLLRIFIRHLQLLLILQRVQVHMYLLLHLFLLWNTCHRFPHALQRYHRLYRYLLQALLYLYPRLYLSLLIVIHNLHLSSL